MLNRSQKRRSNQRFRRGGSKTIAMIQQKRREVDASREQLDQTERRLQAVLRLNRSLAESSAGLIDGRSLMDTALSTITELAGALGCSFVPIDEWQQPLPALTHGRLPEPVLAAWASHLANGMLRERCGNCGLLHSSPEVCPLHPAQVGSSLTIYCIVQNLEERNGAMEDNFTAPPLAEPARQVAQPVGVLHIYLPTGRSLDADLYHFVEGLLGQVALAYQASRLREQEQVTLRQLQMLHAPEGDFTASLGVLLEGLVQALEADFALVRVRHLPEERLSGFDITCGDVSRLGQGELERIADLAMSAALGGEPAASPAECLPVWLALPLHLPEGTLSDGKTLGSFTTRGSFAARSSLGILVVGVDRPYEFHPRQRVILQAVAAQSALLVDNERLFRSLEYKTVIQERARLAREIHDGLAQTLAFLKLQATQMQSYLAQGDLARLGRILKDNYQTLAEAYLDTRQAIDDLRLTPQEGLERWLERLLNEFENGTGLRVERDIRPLGGQLAPEVQAQLVRIIQEALSNVRKHARASQVWVSLVERKGETILEVRDDGLGFSAEDVPDITRHGLRGMRERAELLGADFQMISQPLQGTTMRLVLPASLAEEPSP